MIRIAICLMTLCTLAACKDDTNRVISQHVSPAGHAFTLMPITERGVTDITISVAWTSDYLLQSGNNAWVPGLGTHLMLSGGTADLSPADLQDLLEDKNSWGNLYATSDYVYGEVEYPNNYRDDVLPILAEMFQQPVFDAAWFARTQAQWIEHLTGQAQPDADQLWDASRLALFGDTPQTDFLNGTDFGQLEAVTLDDIRDWHKAIVTHRPSTIVVTGAVNVADAGEAIDTLLPPPGAAPIDPAPLLVTPRFSAKAIYLHLPEAEKSTLAFLGPLPRVVDNEAMTDVILINLLGGGPDSPLFAAIREDLGATYGMGVELAGYSRSQRSLAIYGEIETAKMAAARDAVLKTYADFLTAPDITNLSDVTTRWADDIREDNTSVSGSASTLRELLLVGRDPQDYHSMPDDVAAITPQQLQARLSDAFPPADALMVFAVGPDPSAFPDACVIASPQEVLDC